MELTYHVFHRKVKYARLEIKNGDLHLILPHGVDDYHSLINKHENWIYRKISRINRLKTESSNRKLNLDREDGVFRETVNFHIDKISQDMNLDVNMVRFRRMKSRWGSCSSSGNITINTRLKYLPEFLIEYVVHHEICHLLERKHNKNFWIIIAQKYTDYEKYEDELSIYWFLVKDLN